MIARRIEVAAAPQVVPRLRRLTRRQRGTILRGLALAVYTLVTVFPFYWMVITIFKQNSDLYSETNNPLWFNAAPTLSTRKPMRWPNVSSDFTAARARILVAGAPPRLSA